MCIIPVKNGLQPIWKFLDVHNCVWGYKNLFVKDQEEEEDEGEGEEREEEEKFIH